MNHHPSLAGWPRAFFNLFSGARLLAGILQRKINVEVRVLPGTKTSQAQEYCFTALARLLSAISALPQRVAFLLLFLLATGLSGTAQADMTLTAAGVAAGFTLTTFATNFPDTGNGGTGPVGITFPGSGVMVSDWPGHVRVFPSHADGQNAGTVPATTYGTANAVGLAQVAGRFYMTQDALSRVVQVNADGTLNQVIVNVFCATGLVADSFTGHLYVSGGCTGAGITEVDPVAKTATAFNSVLSDGLALSSDGHTLYAAEVSTHQHVLGFNTTTKAQVFDSGVINGVDGIAVGSGSLAGKIFVNTNFGELWEVDLATSAQTLIASGGSRGDFVAWDPSNGTLLVTQSDRILRLHPPVVTTNPATTVATFSATLNGSLNPRRSTTTVDFQYGPTTSYGHTTPVQTQTGNTFRLISANISGLTASTTYHFRIVAHDTGGTSFGSDRTFTTLTVTGPPVVITSPATLVASFSGTLNGSVDPHGLTTSVHFQYGTTTSYGLTTAPQSHTGNTYLNVSANISGLLASHVYHYRIVATNSAGTRFGADRTVTTLTATGAPVVTTNPATNVTSSSATLNGSLDPHGLTTSVHFQYGATTSYGLTTPVQSRTGNTYLNISANITGLSANHVYHFRIVATNSAGTRMGSDKTFTTPAQGGYVVTLRQVGSNVVATGSGVLDTAGLAINIDPPFAPGLVQPDAGAITTGPPGFAPDAQRFGNLVSGPASFGSGGQTLASSGSGDTVGFAVGQPSFTLIVPQNCMFSSSCGPLSDSSTYAGATFASLGITPGTYEWRWGAGLNQKFTLQVE
jgi:hypothetical protein